MSHLLNEATMQQLLGRHLFDQGHSHICGNFQTTTLPECDLISVDPKGYLCEWEIKLTRADFKADGKKTFKHTCLDAGQGLVARRRGKQLQHLFLCCSFFTYACPPGLLYPADLPAYAGLVWVSSSGQVDVKRLAPVVHTHPADTFILARITHNLTQKYLYGCSRTTFANRGGEATTPVTLPPAPPAPAPVPAPTRTLRPQTEAPAPRQKGRHIKQRDPRPVRRR
jgi:hypothetical protein